MNQAAVRETPALHRSEEEADPLGAFDDSADDELPFLTDLRLEPRASDPAGEVGRRGVLRDIAFDPAGQNLIPCLPAVRRQPTHGVYQAGVVDDALEDRAAGLQ